MKYILPTLGVVAAVSLFALSNANQTAIAVERPSYKFQHLENMVVLAWKLQLKMAS